MEKDEAQARQYSPPRNSTITEILLFYDRIRYSITWYSGYYLATLIFVISLFILKMRRKNPTWKFLWLTLAYDNL